MLGEQVVNFLVGFVDVYLAGTLSKDATAAVGTGAYVGWFVTLGFFLVSTGAAALVSRAVGARDEAQAGRLLNQAMLMALIVGVLVAAGAWGCAPFFAHTLTRTATAEVMCRDFLRIDSFGYILASLTLVGGAAVRAAGDTRTPMLVMTLVSAVNAGLSSGLVFGWFGPRLGVYGIAIGTVAARSLGGLLMAVVLLRGLGALRIERRLLRPDWLTIARMLRIGLPAAADAAVMAVAQLAFVAIIARTAAGDAGTANYAAHMIAMRMEAISYLPALAWATAGATLVGQALGARDPRRAARAGHLAAIQGAALTTAVGVGFYLLAEPIYRMMSDDPAVIAVGAPAFRLIAFAQPVLGAAIVYIGVLRGAGDTRATLVFSLIGGLALRVPGAWLGGIALGGGLIGAWCGMWSDNVAKLLLGGGRFLQGGWKRLRL